MKYIIVGVGGIRLIRGKKGFFDIEMLVKKENEDDDKVMKINKVFTSNEWKKVEKDGYFIES